ncbi:MAG: SDR family NAD(P)-dependent oxidoreductase [Terracidiphilus sp.]
MNSGVVIRKSHVAQFAAACGDRNPLHLNSRYSRTTPFGQPVVHGVLAAIACLTRLDASALAQFQELRLDFHHPVLPATAYKIQVEAEEQKTAVRLLLGDMVVLSAICAKRVSVVDSRTSGQTWTADLLHADLRDPWRSKARTLDAGTLPILGLEHGSYGVDVCRMRTLLEQIGGESMPFHIVSVLSWASYWTGMHTPGRDALLGQVVVRLNRIAASPTCADSAHSLYRVEPPSFHRRTGLVTIEARVLLSEWAADITVESLLRQRAPQATCESVARHLSPSDELVNKFMVVIGGSRGLGRAITLALVQLGATVLVVHRRSLERVTEMRHDAGQNGHRILSVACDAADGAALYAALDAQAIAIDGLILAAAPVIPSLPFHLSTINPSLRYLERAVRLVWAPLAACASRLKDGATLVVLSSEAVEEPPVLWPHYVSAKMAIEGLARHAAKQRPWHVIIVRPSRLWTELTSGPTGAIGTTPVELIASHIASRLATCQSWNGNASLARQATVLSTSDISSPVPLLLRKDEEHAEY